MVMHREIGMYVAKAPRWRLLHAATFQRRIGKLALNPGQPGKPVDEPGRVQLVDYRPD